MPERTDELQRSLAALSGKGLRRERVIARHDSTGGSKRLRVDGRDFVAFCDNDYLGLAGDPRLAIAFREASARTVGSGASHLITGHGPEHAALEAELAAWLGRERALLLSTGYMANLAAQCALASRGKLLLADRLNHASLIDGARLSGARLRRYRHLDGAHAATLADADRAPLRLIASDGLFSMDGDIAPVAELATLANRHDAWLLIDDAHGLGVVGDAGRGTLEAAGCETAARSLVLVGTLGKAFGCFGAFIAGEAAMIEWLVQSARTYIYTTALPEAVAAAARAALKLIIDEPWRRERLQALTARFRRRALAAGLPLSASTTAIQPLIIGSAARAVAASAALRERGYWVSAIRPPTVPAGSARLRITFAATHRETDIDGLVDALAESFAEPTNV
ncbi:MAG: 8-amino-7-oxononanoate synthase [Steroidobacteraceae bacterium]